MLPDVLLVSNIICLVCSLQERAFAQLVFSSMNLCEDNYVRCNYEKFIIVCVTACVLIIIVFSFIHQDRLSSVFITITAPLIVS